jgi:hypothetical protein
MMNLKSILLALGSGAVMAASTFAQGTAFTYQGQLYSGTNPANGTYDFQFALSNSLSGGSQIGTTLSKPALGVTNGLFITTLDFGTVFNGQSAWLGLSVRSNGTGNYVSLSPLQPVTPAPYAVYAESTSASNLIGTVQSGNLSGVALLNASNTFTAGPNTFNGSVGIGTSTPNSPLAVYGNIFMGKERNNTVFNQIGDTIYLGAEQKYLGNTLGTAVDGSTDWINLMANSLSAGLMFGLSTSTANPHSNIVPLMVIKSNGNVGIGATNPATALQVNGTVTAASFTGDGSGLANVALLNQQNTFTAQQTFRVGVGTYGCLMTDGIDELGSYIAQGQCSFGTISHHALGFFVNNGFDSMDLNTNGNLGIGTSTPANKLDVQGSGDFTGKVGVGTTSPAKTLEVAGSATGVAAGGSVDPSVLLRVLNVATDGTETNSDVAGIGFGNNSTREAIVGATYGYDFMDFYVAGVLTSPAMRILGNGYVGIGTTSPQNKLDVNGEINCTALNITSDRNAKQDFTALNPRDVLAKVATLPITEWQYKAEKDKDSGASRHIGPMAQDFRSAFSLGADGKHISVVDESGVALAAIQGLNQKLDEKDARIQQLEQSLSELKTLVNRLAARDSEVSR